MTDEEINRRVAEIEGASPTARDSGIWFVEGFGYTEGPPPYVTDWAWTGPLIEKHGIGMDLAKQYSSEKSDGWLAWTQKGSPWSAEVNWDLRRAICRAVIAAHEGKDA